MAQKTTVYIVDEDLQAIDALASLLRQTPDLTVIGKAVLGRAAMDNIGELLPDVAVISLDLRDVDSLELIRGIASSMRTRILVTSARADRELIDRAGESGAIDFLSKPFLPSEAVEAIRSVAVPPGSNGNPVAAAEPAAARQSAPLPPAARGQVVTVFGTKGGVGKSTVAINTAVAISLMTRDKVVLVDLDLEFGSAAAMLGCKSLATIIDLIRARADLRPDVVERVLLNVNGTTMRLLASPPTPDLAAEVEGEIHPGQGNAITAIITALRQRFDWIVIDTASNFRDVNLTAFDMSDLIYVLTTPDIPTLQNTGKCLDVLLDQLGYDRAKVKLVLNHADAAVGLTPQDVTGGLEYPISHNIPRDNQTAAWAANCGRPFVLDSPKLPISEAIIGIARSLVNPQAEDGRPQEKRRRLFGRHTR
ncbi:MAG: response regulator [Chloroflexota bacterium]